MRYAFLFYLLVMIVSFPISSQAQWSNDPSENTRVTGQSHTIDYHLCASDGTGGIIVAWQSIIFDTIHLFAQRLDANGVVQWETGGVPICTKPYYRNIGGIISDGFGGAIIAWDDFRGATNYDVYAQRINSAGVVQWTTNGVPMCTATNDQTNPRLVSDGAGGAIIIWNDYRTYLDIYAQRVNANGIIQWSANGVAVCATTDQQYDPEIVSDQNGGAICIWNDRRRITYIDIYSQRLNAQGISQWATNGIAIYTQPSTGPYEIETDIISDNTGNAIVTWTNGSSNSDVFVQKIISSGVVQWTSNGVIVTNAAGNQLNPMIVSDGFGGAFISWDSLRTDTYRNKCLGRIRSTGVIQWTINSLVERYDFDFHKPKMIVDGNGGVIIVWSEEYLGADYDIYAQLIDAYGETQWSSSGEVISNDPNFQGLPSIAQDGTGGAIISWLDTRNDIDGAGLLDIYAQRIDNFGYLGANEPAMSLVSDVQNDQGGNVSVGWEASQYDRSPHRVVTDYTVWIGIEEPVGAVSSTSSVWKTSSGKTYRRKETSNGSTYWELVGSVPSHYFTNYKFTAPTSSDSGPNGVQYYKFLVSAQTANQFVFWDSNVDSGYSKDNLVPSPTPTPTVQNQSGSSVVLRWSGNSVDPDVGAYELHRSRYSGFTVSASTKIAETSDTILTDDSPLLGYTNYYRVVTRDIHGNGSEPSPEISATFSATINYNQQDKWNMVSVPLTVSNYTKSALYPSSLSDAFSFNGGYTPQATLQNGIGYWLKFSGTQQVAITGYHRDVDTVDVQDGWNMIGTISSSVPVNQIGSIPVGLVTSQFFGYNNGYFNASELEAGKGYWVKVNGGGKLIISSGLSNQSSVQSIKVIATNELPPPPPEGDGNVYETTNLKPETFSLEQNYPNPFNPSTVIRYQLPVGREGFSTYNVTLKVYNTLGVEVATLYDGLQVSGYRFAEWDASGLASGMYFYRLTAGMFSDIKQLILLK